MDALWAALLVGKQVSNGYRADAEALPSPKRKQGVVSLQPQLLVGKQVSNEDRADMGNFPMEAEEKEKGRKGCLYGLWFLLARR